MKINIKKTKLTRSAPPKSSSSSVNDTSDELHGLKFGFDERLESPVTLSTVSNDGAECKLDNWDLIYFSGEGGKRDGGWRGIGKKSGTGNLPVVWFVRSICIGWLKGTVFCSLKKARI